MPDDELRDWLLQRKEVGLSRIIMSFAGMGKFHDTWVGRRGEYDFLLTMAKIAAELDMERFETIFLTKSTLPQLELLMNTLDGIPNLAERTVLPLLYRGRARNMEDERITQDMLEQCPERILKYLDLKDLATECEWITRLGDGYESPFAYRKSLIIRLREDNIDELETRTCDEILSDLTKRYDKVHAALPELNELAKTYGDVSNVRMYFIDDLERKWTQRYVQENPEISREDYELVYW